MSSVIWITVLTTSLYVVANNLPAGIGSFRFIWAPITLLAILVNKPIVYTRKSLVLLLFYGVFSLGFLQYTLWTHMDSWNRSLLLNELYALLVFTSIYHYYFIRKDLLGIARIGKIGFIFILITIVMTNIALSFDSLIVRQSASPGNFTPYQARIFNITGAANYGYMQALVCFIPILIYHIKYRKKLIFSNKLLVIILILLLLTIIRAQVLANVLAAFAITAISFMAAKRKKMTIIIIIFTSFILATIPASSYSNYLFKVSNFLDEKSVIRSKLYDFAKFVEDPDFESTTGAGERANRYPMLFEAFIEDPLFGYSSHEHKSDILAGGHIYWMNKLTQWGIFGFLLFLTVIYNIYKSVRKNFNEVYGFYYFLSVMTFVFMGLMKNIAGREPFLVILVIIPGIYFLPLLEKQKPKNNVIQQV